MTFLRNGGEMNELPMNVSSMPEAFGGIEDASLQGQEL